MTDKSPSLKPVADVISRRSRAPTTRPPTSYHSTPNAKARSRRTGEIEPAAGDFSVEEINRAHALVLMGSKAVVVKEMADAPLDDRQRIITVEAFSTWFGNRFTEIRDANGKVRTVTWARAWLNSRDQRRHEGIEFYPDPDNAVGTPGYLNLWRGFAFRPVAKPNGWKTFRDHLLNNVCGSDEKLSTGSSVSLVTWCSVHASASASRWCYGAEWAQARPSSASISARFSLSTISSLTTRDT